MKIINFFFPVLDFVYLFQQEEYSFQRFNFWFWRFFFRRSVQKRDRLVFTLRAKILVFLSIIFFILSNILFSTYLFLIASIVFFPLYIALANFISSLFFVYLQDLKIKQAAEYLKSNKKKETKIIAIIGSFGKTTTKNILLNILKTKYKVGYIEGNINTPLGIANWILKDFDKSVDVFICEVDGYNKKEYKNTISILNPDITILTNIGDQHLQRFGSREKLAQSLTQALSKSRQNFLLKKDFEYLRNLNFINLEKNNLVVVDDVNLELNEDKKYLTDNYKLAIKVSKEFDIKSEYITHVLENFVEVDRRGNISQLFGFETLDSSYNISFTTGKVILSEAERIAKSKNKKLLVAFAGIPELAPNEKEKNTEFAKMISQTATDFVFFKSIFIDDMLKGVEKIDSEKIVLNFKEFEKVITKKYPSEEYFLLLFPELTDIYY